MITLLCTFWAVGIVLFAALWWLFRNNRHQKTIATMFGAVYMIVLFIELLAHIR